MTARLVRPRWETPKPRGVCGSYGDDVDAWVKRRLGMTLDPWQRYALTNALRYDRKGDLIANTALVSVARQNGKSLIVRGFFGWMLDEGRLLPAFSSWSEMLAAAHDAKQARIPYKGVLRDLSGLPEWRGALSGSGARRKEYRLTQFFGLEADGLTFDTVTGQPESARGHSAGAIAWDEVLTQKDWDGYASLSPTQMAQRNPIMFLTSTAGFSDSVVLRFFYDRLVRIAKGEEAPDPTFYGAWWQSEDPSAGLDWKQIRMSNPSLDIRIPRKMITSEFGKLPPDNWSRERLNHWIDAVAETAFGAAQWGRLRTPAPLATTLPPYVLGIDIQPGWDRASIVAAGIRSDQRVGVEVVADLRADGSPITAQRIIDAVRAFPHPVSVVAYDAICPAAAEFARYGESSWGEEWRALTPSKVVAACMDATELVQSGRLAVDDPLLDAQMVVVGRRNVGQDGGFRFSRAHSVGAIDAAMAMTFAAHVAINATSAPAMI